MRSEHFLEDWRHWSGREDLSDELARILSAVPHGDSELAECVAAAKRIDISDENSWFCEWAMMADAATRLAELVVGRCTKTAERHWHRAINYCRAAALPFDREDQRQQAAIARMRSCARAYLHHRDVQGEVVTIPWRDDFALEGYFLPAVKAGREPAPALICFSEPGQRKEAHLLNLARLAADRGLSLLLVDLFGAEAGEGFDEVIGSRNLETAVGSVMDYLTLREDIDENRIAILADEWGSSFVARGIAFDTRYAAAVCDAGLWDIHEQAFLTGRVAATVASAVGGSRVARHIMCPVLIAVKEQGWLDIDHVARLVAEMKAERPGIAMTLKIFSGESEVSENLGLSSEFIFDWIAARLGKTRKLQS